MKPIPLDIPAGVYKNGTPAQGVNRWGDTQLVRWVEGALQPQAGWRKRTNEIAGVPTELQVSGMARTAHAWRDNLGIARLAIGTHTGLYMFENGLDMTLLTVTPAVTGGIASAALYDGYGIGDYGVPPGYGLPRDVDEASATFAPASAWVLDNWGENLIALLREDGRLLEHVPGAASAAAITGAPLNNRSFVVTNERILMALGAANDPRLIMWSDVEDNTDWVSTPLNFAGELHLQTNGEILAGKVIPDGILVWTTEQVFLGRFIGLPYVYGFTPITGRTSLASINAMGVIDSRCIWMGTAGFWLYDGGLTPMRSDVADWVFRTINKPQIGKVWCLVNHAMNEVVWFYPGEASNEIDSYVTYNYKDGEQYWITGKIVRTCGVPAGVFQNPIIVDADGWLWNHGVGYDYPGATPPFAESWPIEIGDGEHQYLVKKIIPDELQLGDVRVSFKSQHYPTKAMQSFGPYTLANPTNIRVPGREIAIRFEGVRPVNWRVGRMKMEIAPLGQR